MTSMVQAKAPPAWNLGSRSTTTSTGTPSRSRRRGTLGNAIRNLAVGPAFWQIDLAISKLVSVGTQRLELRFESFNLFNHFNWGNPSTNFNAGSFGRITTQAGTPRILQFGVKYDF